MAEQHNRAQHVTTQTEGLKLQGLVASTYASTKLLVTAEMRSSCWRDRALQSSQLAAIDNKSALQIMLQLLQLGFVP